MKSLHATKLIKNFFLSVLITAISICSFAQEKNLDTTTIKIDTTVLINTSADRLKDIKKLEDERIKIPADLIFKLKKMGPDELVNLSERFIYNDKVEDENGDKYEVTITVRLGFSQDMITGIVKEVPLYNSAIKETNIINIKIPVQFCCSTPIDTLHKKQHCGKMSELNDFEDKEHCKAWIQKDKTQQDKEAAKMVADSIAKLQSKTNLKKKGSGTNKIVIDSIGGFGKPIPKGKTSQKNKSAFKEIEVTDSTGNVISVITVPYKKEKKDNKSQNKKQINLIQPITDSINYKSENIAPIIKDSSVNEFGKKPDNKKKKRG
jgi:hypothetical protein